MENGLDDIVQITDAAYRMRVAAFQRLRIEELRLRQELERVSQMVLGTDLGQSDLFVMQSLGADLLWQAWVVRQRTQINMQLAQVLAQREIMLRDLRLAFGRAQVAQMLHNEDAIARRKAVLKRRTEG